ncbi:MAG: hypothetical protein U0610_07390 [bacterium]
MYVEALAQYCGAGRLQRCWSCRFRQPCGGARFAGRLGSAVSNAVDADVTGGKLAITASAYGSDTRVVYEFQGGGARVVSVTANAVSIAPPAASRRDTTTRAIAVDLVASANA